MFPDGDVWIEQTPIAENLDVYLQNLITGHKDKSLWADRAQKLWSKGDVWWKDNLGVEHRMAFEAVKRPTKWGTNTEQKGLGTMKRLEGDQK